MHSARFIFAASVLLIFAGCTFGGGSTSGTVGAPLSASQLTTPIKNDTASKYLSHIIVIVQENRTFEDFFAGYPGANAPMVGCGLPQKGHVVSHRVSDARVHCPKGDVKIPLHQITFEHSPNLSHEFESAILDYDGGKMDGFSHWGLNHDDAAYAYVERSQVQTYWNMAQNYVLADEMFPTEFGPSWTAHITIIAGTDTVDKKNTLALADFADGHSACGAVPGTTTTTVNIDRHIGHNGPFPCLDQFKTMANALDNAGVSWRYYVALNMKTFIWSPFAAIKYVRRGSDWNNIVEPETQVLDDIKSGNLASVSWVTPNKLDSDHPNSHNDSGPSWVASVVNTLGKSSYWNSSAVVVLWDDFGGFYDNAPPPQLDYRGLGIRVPCLIISPYAKRGYVSHTQYEYGSILKFIEEVFPTVHPLGPTDKGYTDTRAASLDDAFQFDRAPRKFRTIPQKYPASYFFQKLPTDDIPDND